MRVQKMQSKQILLFLIMGFLLFLSFSLMTSFKKRSLPGALTEGAGKADVKIGQFSFVQTHEGTRDWELKADRAEMYEKDQRVVLERIAVTLETPQGLELKLKGDKGTIDTYKKDFFLKNDNEPIVVQLSNGYIVKVPALQWLNDQRKIVSEGPVHIAGPRVEVDGKALTVEVENQEVTVSGDVQASVY